MNATAAAKRRFHRPGRTWRHHLGFVLAHVQPFVLALVVPGLGWTAAAVVYGLVVAGALVVPAALAWFAPVLLVKLLLGHLLPEEAAHRWTPAS